MIGLDCRVQKNMVGSNLNDQQDKKCKRLF